MKLGSLKVALTSVAVAGAASAALFGGGAVATAFSSDANANIAVQADTVSMTHSGMSNMTISGLVPGGSASAKFTVNNTSNTPADLYLTGLKFEPTANGSSGSAPDASEITVTVTDANTNTPPGGVTILGPESLSQLEGQNVLVASPMAQDLPQDITVTFTLDQGAGNDWNGASALVPFTLHLQDSNGTDANGFVATSSK